MIVVQWSPFSKMSVLLVCLSCYLFTFSNYTDSYYLTVFFYICFLFLSCDVLINAFYASMFLVVCRGCTINALK